MVPLILGGLAAAQGIAKIFGANAQDKKLTGMVNAAGVYQEDPEVKGNLSLAKNLFNGQSGASTLAQQLILGNQANTMNSIQRGATDSSQVTAIAEAINSGTNAALVTNAQNDMQDQQGRFGQVQSAVQMLNNEKSKVWADRMRQLNQLRA